MAEDDVPVKRKVGRPLGSLCGKYKDDNGNPLGVMEWRRIHPGWLRQTRELNKELIMKSKEIIITTEIPYEEGFIYFVVKDELGNMQIDRAKPIGRPNPKNIKMFQRLIEQEN